MNQSILQALQNRNYAQLVRLSTAKFSGMYICVDIFYYACRQRLNFLMYAKFGCIGTIHQSLLHIWGFDIKVAVPKKKTSLRIKRSFINRKRSDTVIHGGCNHIRDASFGFKFTPLNSNDVGILALALQSAMQYRLV